jgi:hypothetical protein
MGLYTPDTQSVCDGADYWVEQLPLMGLDEAVAQRLAAFIEEAASILRHRDRQIAELVAEYTEEMGKRPFSV